MDLLKWDSGNIFPYNKTCLTLSYGFLEQRWKVEDGGAAQLWRVNVGHLPGSAAA